MNREKLIVTFSNKMLISKDEVAKYDTETRDVFNELVNNGCIRLIKMKTFALSAPRNRIISGEEEKYQVDPYEIKRKYKELF